jgi:hypothetical protein
MAGLNQSYYYLRRGAGRGDAAYTTVPLSLLSYLLRNAKS